MACPPTVAVALNATDGCKEVEAATRLKLKPVGEEPILAFTSTFALRLSGPTLHSWAKLKKGSHGSPLKELTLRHYYYYIV
uniref:Uncharacterized protein n=1 Tax=Oryza brachyantha TaxID=4533 RepID=J3M4P0_ORYBR